MKFRVFLRGVGKRIWRKVNRGDRFKSKSSVAGQISASPEGNRSPSLLHQDIATQLAPSLSFQDQDFWSWQTESRRKLTSLLGPLEGIEIVRDDKIWVAEDAIASYQKGCFLTNEGDQIHYYKCLPKAEIPPLSWILCLQGHTSGAHVSLGLDKEYEEYREDIGSGRNFGDWCVEHGFAALCIEQSCFGHREEVKLERRSPHPCHDAAMHALILGRTLMGERVRDVCAVTKFLRTSESSQIKKIGIMGNSLGGSVSLYAGAVNCADLDFVIAGSCISSIDVSLLKIYHCADLYIPGLRRYFDLGDVMGMIAPNPLIGIQGKCDPIFPLEGFEKAKQQAEKCYSASGRGANLICHLGDEGHRFYPDLASQGVAELRQRGFFD